jgi:hypothetical protein
MSEPFVVTSEVRVLDLISKAAKIERMVVTGPYKYREGESPVMGIWITDLETGDQWQAFGFCRVKEVR